MAEFKLRKIKFELTAGPEPSWEIPESDQPFCVLMLGDFSGGQPRRDRAAGAGRWQDRGVSLFG